MDEPPKGERIRARTSRTAILVGVVRADAPRARTLLGEEGRRRSRASASKQRDARYYAPVPRNDQEQQNQERQQRARRAIGNFQRRVMIHDLARNARVLLCCRIVLVEQAETVKIQQAKQRRLDDEGAPAVSPISTRCDHARLRVRISRHLTRSLLQQGAACHHVKMVHQRKPRRNRGIRLFGFCRRGATAAHDYLERCCFD